MVKTTYKKVKILSDTNAAYMAGLIDGEGTITLSKRKSYLPRTVALTISNTDLDLLNWVEQAIGAGRITAKRTYAINHSASYTYQIHNRQAIKVISQIIGYLKTYKKFRADLILKYYINLTPRNGKYTSKILAKRSRFIELFFSMKPNITKDQR